MSLKVLKHRAEVLCCILKFIGSQWRLQRRGCTLSCLRDFWTNLADNFFWGGTFGSLSRRYWGSEIGESCSGLALRQWRYTHEFWSLRLSEGGWCSLCAAVQHMHTCNRFWHSCPWLLLKQIVKPRFLAWVAKGMTELPMGSKRNDQVANPTGSGCRVRELCSVWLEQKRLRVFIIKHQLVAVHPELQKWNPARFGQCPHPAPGGKSQGAECGQRKGDWRQNELHSGLTVVSRTRWTKRGTGRSPAAHQIQERLVLNGGCWELLFLSFSVLPETTHDRAVPEIPQKVVEV